MMGDEGLDLSQERLVCHGPHLSRVITRRSTKNAGLYTKLRVIAREPIPAAMDDMLIDFARLKADMADCVERTSARKFSLAATAGRNPDFYRNFANNGQDKRMSAEVYAGIVHALGKSADYYIRGATTPYRPPNAAVLTSTFAMLLDSLGIDPFEDGRAQKLAAQFPGALKRIEDLHAQTAADLEHLRGEETPDVGEDQPPA
ncbi:hypothetical protein EDF56_106352 [Novosphingobium sp. PhB165]|uniref:hypothetical protein n=1 Tax=Novosphingobium sp. PhB165 TaxID=2485105 RepID=UPI0010DB5C7F|nr:hypothetical protein [Novosphingobium sp. PhB165]TCM17236.1 hypothetical protein EDF56_106352 [Novosphingobium sp. PhB165]